MIVKCKRIVIANMMLEREAQGIDKKSREEEELLLGKTLSFGRIGKACMGKPGLLAVNVSIMITQFGFTSGYFIFMGNTLRSVFKHWLVPPTDYSNITTPITRNNTSYLHHTSSYTTPNSQMLINTTLYNTSLSTLHPFLLNDVNASMAFDILHHHFHKLQTAVQNPLSTDNLLKNSSMTFALLTLIPLPILIGISFVRNLRKLGPISVIANNSIVIAWLATVVYMLVTRLGEWY